MVPLLILAVLVVPHYGALGVAFSWFIAYIFYYLFYVFAIRPFFRDLRAWERDGSQVSGIGGQVLEASDSRIV